MGQVIIQRNPLNAALNETVEHEGPLIDWAVERFPEGFPAKTLLTFNGEHLEVRDMDRVVGPEDEVYLLMEPGAPVVAYMAAVGVSAGLSAATAAVVANAVVGAAISLGLSMVSNWLRGTPDADSGQGERETPSPTYSLTIPTNRARLGEAMPVVYGTVKTVPDIVSQPYRTFINNLPFPEYVFMMVAIGRGEHSFNREDIYIGDSSIGSRENPMQDATIIDYKSFPPDRHNGNFGHIQDNCFTANADGKGANDGQPTGSWVSPRFFEDVENSIEIDNQELRHAIIVGNYVANRAGSSTADIYVDIEFPNGLYAQYEDYPGQIFGTQVDFTVYTRQIDHEGNDVGPSTVAWNFFVNLGTTAPVRQTFLIPGGAGNLPYGRYRVSMRRSTVDSTSSYLVNRSYWTGLRAILLRSYENGSPVPEYQDCYEDMHLVVFRIKATEGVARDAANRISINVTRKLELAGGYTSNPAYVMYDMFLNTTYGAGRPSSELDVAKVSELIGTWHNIADGFNAVYDQATSVWPAMQQALRLGDATPVIYGGVVTVAEDKAGVHQHVFNESVIVDGSVSTTYSLNDTTDYDCYEVEYLDTESYIPRYSRYPADGNIPLQVRYFGCTNEAMAAHQAQFLWFKRTFRRKRVSFQTEAIGNLPLVGDKMYVQHPVVSSSEGENYIVESVAPEGQFSVKIQGIVDPYIYSDIPSIYSDIPSTTMAAQLPAPGVARLFPPDAEEDT